MKKLLLGLELFQEEVEEEAVVEGGAPVDGETVTPVENEEDEDENEAEEDAPDGEGE